VTPELDHLLLGIVEIFLGLEKTQEDLGHVSHVELIVTELRSRHEGSLDCVEDLNGGESHRFLELFDLIVEPNELVVTNRSIDILHDGFTGLGVIKHVERRNDTRSNHSSTTTRLSHSSDKL
jgi:hypothetical protein